MKKALHKLAKSEPDIVLLDLKLKNEINGLDLLLNIRTNPRLEQTSVIIMTAYPEMVQASEVNAELILYKPVDINQLVDLLNRFGTFRNQFKQRPFIDKLTGAYNKDFFIARLEHAINHARRRYDFIFASIMLYPVLVNNTGLKIDKSLLVQVAKRLNHQVRLTDTVARPAGTTFCTLLEDIKSPQNVQIVIDRIEDNVCGAYDWFGQTVLIAIYLGAVVYDRHYNKPEEILKITQDTLSAARASTDNKHLIVPTYGQPPINRLN